VVVQDDFSAGKPGVITQFPFKDVLRNAQSNMSKELRISHKDSPCDNNRSLTPYCR